MLLVSYIFFLSKTFLVYINIMFLTLLTCLSCSILYLCLFCYKMGGKWLIDLDWIIIMIVLFFYGLIHILDTCSLVRLHIDLDFSLLPYFDYLVIFFPTHCFTLGICVLVCASYKYWDTLLDLDASFDSLHVIGWLGLDECD